MPTSKVIRFYFDYESPNAYLAWTQLPKLAKKYHASIEPVPVLYAALLDAHGSLGPGEMPAKGRWMRNNILRKSAILGVPLNPTPFFPFNPLLALRVSLLAGDVETQTKLITALFDATWSRSLHIAEQAVVEGAANEAGLDGAALVAEAQQDAVKTRLRRQTDDAIAKGVFGVPTMEVGEQLFWGYDDFPFLEMLLAGKDPLPVAELAKWARPVKPSGMRRRFRQ